MSRVFYDSGLRVKVSQAGEHGLLLEVGEQQIDLNTEALAQRVVDAISQALRDLHRKDPRD